ncbi:hypothetical protein DQ384_26245 [Sphaerisporangium album]|uniref:Uncharacterized protein n=1 Tax=Sphaerisporangium album TaxID=509200 RepID=A0A367FA24_9ACTN|nr:hypothetical protein [Sphaerisporangium album]RCG27223.1 hypothetical protein DQ384_26245 [Sphaerisporangium album]
MAPTGKHQAARDELDRLIVAHLDAHPRAQLTAGDIARAIRRDKGSVAKALPRVQLAGLVVGTPTKNPYGSRPMMLWQAAPKQRDRSIVTCKSCQQRGPHGGRGLCTICHGRHKRKGTLTQFPLLGNPHKDKKPWQPKQARSRALVRDYEFLIDQGERNEEALARELGCSVRHVQRLAGASRTRQKEQPALQTGEGATP